MSNAAAIKLPIIPTAELLATSEEKSTPKNQSSRYKVGTNKKRPRDNSS